LSSVVVSLRGISKSFAGKRVIHDLDLDIAQGEFLTLLGPSGCGKTTVLRLIAGFESADAGSLLIDGRDVSGLPPEQRQVNTVFQNYALFPHMSVAQNLAFGLEMARVARAQIDARVREALATVQLTGLEKRKPHELSGGQQQRVALARALVNRPRVLLLDESLSALDYKLRKQMQGELKSLQRSLGITFVFVTHDQEEALAMSDRVVLLNEGSIAQSGPPREIYERPASLFVARFVGEANIFRGRVLGMASPAGTSTGTSTGTTASSASHNGAHPVRLQISGVEFLLRSSRTHAAGEELQVMVRPEDLRVYAPGEALPDGQPHFHGKIVERTYKGMTLDSVIELDDGTRVTASEFFDEDAPDFDHPLGERVRVTWVPDWETLLPVEAQA
jgi:spermidine/putrescine transport system ATP-binding protein